MTRAAQLLLVLAAVGVWGASRLVWVEVGTFDGLGQPKTVTLTGSTWASALVPLALVLLAAAVAALAVRGWPLRVVAVLVAAASAGIAYLGIVQWVVTDVAPRALELKQIPVTSLTGSHRYYTGAVLTLVAAVCALVAAVLLIRAAGATKGAGRYAAPAARRAAVRRAEPAEEPSERMLWDALDEGRDPTDTDNEGR